MGLRLHIYRHLCSGIQIYPFRLQIKFLNWIWRKSESIFQIKIVIAGGIWTQVCLNIAHIAAALAAMLQLLIDHLYAVLQNMPKWGGGGN